MANECVLLCVCVCLPVCVCLCIFYVAYLLLCCLSSFALYHRLANRQSRQPVVSPSSNLDKSYVNSIGTAHQPQSYAYIESGIYTKHMCIDVYIEYIRNLLAPPPELCTLQSINWHLRSSNREIYEFRKLPRHW